jgi:hypothetical protein
MSFDAVWRGLERDSSVDYELRHGYGDVPLVFSLLVAGAVLGIVWLAPRLGGLLWLWEPFISS